MGIITKVNFSNCVTICKARDGKRCKDCIFNDNNICKQIKQIYNVKKPKDLTLY